jgi:hypothetical protein
MTPIPHRMTQFPPMAEVCAPTQEVPTRVRPAHAPLVRFTHIAAQSTLTTPEIYADTLTALVTEPSQHSLASLRYDLSKLRAKGLVEKVPEVP